MIKKLMYASRNKRMEEHIYKLSTLLKCIQNKFAQLHGLLAGSLKEAPKTKQNLYGGANQEKKTVSYEYLSKAVHIIMKGAVAQTRNFATSI
ncbi:MAG: hypothetical protein EZS28_024766 [Streblomastix strix]|uniref:Uncharacterized protein n=1 Tax=Streblomastix strix TaxID=222440 RepID=A0A5J4VB12_9EUKA|nr:MAG: hypothetical protein EZS28_024766 [Streblomastix strix]